MKNLLIFIIIFAWLNPLFSVNEGDPDEKNSDWQKYNNHYVLFKKDYKLFLYPALYDLQEDKTYIKNIFSSMIYDQLRLTKSIWIADPQPAEIIYSSQSSDEDPHTEFMKSYKAQSRMFGLQVLPAASYPAFIKNPEFLVTDKELAKRLGRDDIHAVSFISSKGKDFEFKIFLIRNGIVFFQKEIVSTETELSKNLYNFIQDISVFLSRSETGAIEISASEPKSSIYLNGQFAGYAPLSLPNVISGKNEVIVRKPGFKAWEKTFNISKGEKIILKAQLSQFKSVSKIIVKSNVEKCDVYLDVEFKGQTPIEINSVIPGKQRIHVVKEGYIDYYKTIETSEEENSYEVIAEMKKGNSRDYYTPGQPVFLGLNYDKLFKTSGIITLGTGLLGIFFLVEKEQALNTINSYETYSASTLTDFPQYFDALESNAAAFESLETGFFIASAVFLVSTIYFYIKFAGEQDVPVAFNQPERVPVSSSVHLNLNLSTETLLFAFKKNF